MRIEALWEELEREALAGASEAWLTRFALPKPNQPLLVALEIPSNRRALLLPLPIAAIPARRVWPTCKGLEVFTVALSGEPHLGVRLLAMEYADVFTALAEDVAPRVANAPDPGSASNTLLARLRRWQKFLAAGTDGLPPERQKGLFGELHTLRSHLLPAFGAESAITAWRAPSASHQDFQFPSGAVEVKTTSAKQPQTIRITSERQLDQTGIQALFLHIVILDERKVESGNSTAGESLPNMVDRVRELLEGHDLATEAFEDGLLEAGYLQADLPRYGERRFTLRNEVTFHVTEGFPRLVEKDLPNGVGDVSYALTLSACLPYTVTVQEMLAAVTPHL